jgi:methyl-accepting chemotaxis protein
MRRTGSTPKGRFVFARGLRWVASIALFVLLIPGVAWGQYLPVPDPGSIASAPDSSVSGALAALTVNRLRVLLAIVCLVVGVLAVAVLVRLTRAPDRGASVKSQLPKPDTNLGRSRERAEAGLKSQAARADQERRDDAQGFLRSQHRLDTKVDELKTELRSTQGRAEEVERGYSELSRRIDGFGEQTEQFGRRLQGIEKLVSQAIVAAQEAKTGSEKAVAAAQEAIAMVQHAIATGASTEIIRERISELNTVTDTLNVQMRRLKKLEDQSGSSQSHPRGKQ